MRGVGAPTVVSFTVVPAVPRLPSASKGAHSRRCAGSVSACQTFSGEWRSSLTRMSVHFSPSFRISRPAGADPVCTARDRSSSSPCLPFRWCGWNFLGALHAVEVAFESIYVSGPEPAERSQPGIHLLEVVQVSAGRGGAARPPWIPRTRPRAALADAWTQSAAAYEADARSLPPTVVTRPAGSVSRGGSAPQ